MTRILIAGATGLVGGHVLALALADDRVGAVVAPTRKPLPPHAKLRNPVSDMTRLPADSDWWAVDSVVSALGTTRAIAGSAQAFRAIDFDLQLTIARHARAHGAQRFALTSSAGANPRSPFLYMRTKGEIEEEIDKLGWPSLTIVRPGPIVGKRDDLRLAERVAAGLLRVLAPILPSQIRANPAEDIARTLLEAAINARPGKHLLLAGDIG